MAASTELRDVHVYRMSMLEHECPWGLKAIELMQQRGIGFEDHRLTSKEEVNAFKERTVPLLFPHALREKRKEEPN